MFRDFVSEIKVIKIVAVLIITISKNNQEEFQKHDAKERT